MGTGEKQADTWVAKQTDRYTDSATGQQTKNSKLRQVKDTTRNTLSWLYWLQCTSKASYSLLLCSSSSWFCFMLYDIFRRWLPLTSLGFRDYPVLYKHKRSLEDKEWTPGAQRKDGPHCTPTKKSSALRTDFYSSQLTQNLYGKKINSIWL